jgi:cellulose biosynthesis protein BcsQ
MRTLAIYSNKGGVGKTAAAVNLSYLAARTGLKTLLCDLDPQGSATYYFRVKPKHRSGAKGLVKGRMQVFKSVKRTDYENLDLLPADFSLRHLDIRFSQLKHPQQRLRRILAHFEDEYDLILLDCPVTISVVAENIFTAADFTLVPLIPTTLSLRTYRQLLASCKKKVLDASRIYVFFSMVDGHKKMNRELIAAAPNQRLQGRIKTFGTKFTRSYFPLPDPTEACPLEFHCEDEADMAREIERKFLIKGTGWRRAGAVRKGKLFGKSTNSSVKTGG